MSKANSAKKVLRVALKRIQRGWTKGAWVNRDSQSGQVSVCIEGALFGYCREPQTAEQVEARDIVLEIIQERPGRSYIDIPSWNDDEKRMVEEVEEIIKLAIIRAETGGSLDENEIEEVDELIPRKA